MDPTLRAHFAVEEFGDVIARETLEPLYDHKSMLESELDRVERRIEKREAQLREKHGDDALP